MMKMPERPNVENQVLSLHHEQSQGVSQRYTELRLSPMDMALLELEETVGESLDSTLEDMAMALSGRLRDEKRFASSERQLRRRQELIALMQNLHDQHIDNADFFTSMSESNSEVFDGLRRIFTIIQHLASTTLDEKRRKTLNAQLATLIEENEWETALFGMLELGSINKSVLAPISRLFQRAMDEKEISLLEWFKRILDWDDRQRRIRVLLRMAAFELSLTTRGAQQTRLATVLVRLRRLLLFLGLEHECEQRTLLYSLPPHSLFTLLIEITQESWLFEDWLIARISSLTSCATRFNRIVRYLEDQFRLMPDACFSDEDQRESILSVLRKVGGNQVLS